MSSLVDIVRTGTCAVARPHGLGRLAMPAAGTWRSENPQPTQDGRGATGATYVATDKHFSTRSGPPTARP